MRVVFGSDAAEALTGLSGADTLVGLLSDDTLAALPGDDLLLGDRLVAPARLGGLTDRDVLFGDAGNDTLYGGADDDVLDGGDGADRLYGDYLNRSDGPFGDDTLYGNDGEDVLDGGFGDDLLNGGLGDDTIKGGAGHDRLLGSHGDDSIVGGNGNDTIDGGAGGDTIFGGNGYDVVRDLSGDNKVHAEIVVTGDGDDSIGGTNIRSGGGDDRIRVSHDSFAAAGSGDDSLYTQSPNVHFLGQNGDDTLRAVGEGQGSATLEGGRGNDLLEGGGILRGQQGDDVLFVSEFLNGSTLSGGLGDDVLIVQGGLGLTNLLYGNQGNDRFEIFSSATIADFEHGADKFGIPFDYATGPFDDFDLTPTAFDRISIVQAGEDVLVDGVRLLNQDAGDFDITDFYGFYY